MTTQIDWGKIRLRASSLYCLFTEPKLKADKDAGNLSQTAKTHLIEIYARELWGVERDIMTVAMKKGVECEEQSLTLLSRVDRKFYTKNDERKENQWLSGHADIVEPDEIIDVKTSFDAFSFLPKLTEEVSSMYYYQLQGYMWLWDKPKARVSYCLVDTPSNIIEGEKYRLLRSMDVVSEEDTSFKEAARILESNMKFSHLPMELRVINHYIDRDEETISKIPEKVAKARDYLAELHQKHLNVNLKQ